MYQIAMASFLSIGFAITAVASPWIGTEDQSLRSSLQILSDAGYLSKPVQSYPLNWQDIVHDLTWIDTSLLTPYQELALLRVQAALDFAKRDRITTVALSATKGPFFTDPTQARYLERNRLTLKSEFKGDNWAVGLSRQFQKDSFGGKESNQNWDDSYLAYTNAGYTFKIARQYQWKGQGRELNTLSTGFQRPAKYLEISKRNLLTTNESENSLFTGVTASLQYGSFSEEKLLNGTDYLSGRVSFLPFNQTQIAFSVFRFDTDEPALAEENTDQKYSVPDHTTYSVDLRYSMTDELAVYTEFGYQQFSDDREHGTSTVLGASYRWGAKEYFIDSFIEYKSNNDHAESVFIIKNAQLLTGITEGLAAGLNAFKADGSGGYAIYSRYADEDESIENYKLGYQHPLFGGLLRVDYQFTDMSDASGPAAGMSRHSVGANFEWRW